jgi:hypothetical protein
MHEFDEEVCTHSFFAKILNCVMNIRQTNDAELKPHLGIKEAKQLLFIMLTERCTNAHMPHDRS